ncbi:MAG: peptidase [Flavobacteriaceae bacterium]|nr:peptidase [Flavobacteriaceae bacterium]|tara:strand:- start:427 stop:2877 length:2451 start_codon:yes stop_codon:yes gene_type:complete
MCNKNVFWILFLINFSFGFSQKIKNKSKPNETTFLNNTKKNQGFFTFFIKESKNQVLLEIDEFEEDFLYINSLSTGIGNNDIGLDRGQLGQERIVFFKKMGDKIFLIQPNLKYRAVTENESEKKSVKEAFAKSVLYGFKIEKEIKGKYYINLTPFLLQDAHGVSLRLKKIGEGNYTVDDSRSAINYRKTKSFPHNVEFDVMLTFKGNPEGFLISSVTPSPEAITVNQHHSFVKLPDENFNPRKFDPRSGAIPFKYFDYSSPVNESLIKNFIIKHRLEKINPDLQFSEPLKPIVYYIDPGIPEPIRSAVIEGGKWWNDAFENIGYKNAFRIEMLPNDADPLDIRYNVIQWVHRSTRGWSYGASVVDPRTGEIIKGHVSLGSLRIRQDFLIALGLTEEPYAYNQNKDQQILDLALNRIKQLSAHEIGHTLGFAHNFAASAKDRASVMDYPHPKLKLIDGKINYEDAYKDGIGDWDKISVAYSYSHFPESIQEDKALQNILKKSVDQGYKFISDYDARPIGGAHPSAHLWDNGDNSVNELRNILKIRKIALDNFYINHIKENETVSLLEDRLVPVYLLHRYQIEAVSKIIAGQEYSYAVKTNGNVPKTEILKKSFQKEALDLILLTLKPKNLSLPNRLLDLFPARSYGFSRNRESFDSQTGPTFDYLGISNMLSDKILKLLLHPNRASRLVQQKALDDTHFSLFEMIDQIFESTIKNIPNQSYSRELQNIVNFNVLKNLMSLGASDYAYPQVRAIVYEKLLEIRSWLRENNKIEYKLYFISEIDRFFEEPETYKETNSLRIPDGSPIGIYDCDLNFSWK